MYKLEYDPSDMDLPLARVLTKSPDNWKEMINIKALIGGCLSNLERVFYGIFGDGLDLKGYPEQYELFKRVFPFIGTAMDRTFSQEGFKAFCRRLDNIRNACFHAWAGITPFDVSFGQDFLAEFPNYSPHPYCDDKGNVTLAGFTAILFLLCNNESATYLLKSGFHGLASEIGLFPEYGNLNTNSIPARLESEFGNDFEAGIRTTIGSDPFNALCGEYADKVVERSKGWMQFFNKDEIQSSERRIRFSFSELGGGQLLFRVEKHSHYHIYYPDGYELWIEDRDYFMELANSVPPFMIIPFLYRNKIARLNKSSLTPEQLKMLSKLNYAKFYVDKNVNTLLMGDRFSDIRLMSRSATPQAIFCLLKIEGDLGLKHRGNLPGDRSFSKIEECMAADGFPQELINDTVAMRNFFSHGHLFGDYVGTKNGGAIKIELSTCLGIFKRISEFVAGKDAESSLFLNRTVASRLCESLIDAKYKRATMVCLPILQGKQIDIEAYQKTMKRIEASYITPEIEKMMLWFFEDTKYFRYHVVDCKVRPGFVIGCSQQPYTYDKITLYRLKKGINVQKVMGVPVFGKMTKIFKNPLIYYQEFDFTDSLIETEPKNQ